ncbi:MAG: CRISPR-associated endoribonuclease Cas6 [Lewinellaceae bacterium]|nr:CRISPR-associated endoribonuclease Cas6 [Lewinellaceae bacterium]
MQFKITLCCLDEHPVLPVNYQYELSAWIYGVLQNADAGYAAFLHGHGYTTGRKSFKLFCFSQLRVPKFRIEGDRLHVQSREISFVIGFYVDRTAEEFVRGLFAGRQFRLGDRESQARLAVQTVEMRPLCLPEGTEPLRVRALSPVVVARKRPDDQPDEYLAPDDPDFGRLLMLNLLEKYRAATGAEPPAWWDTDRFAYRVALDREPRSKLIKIKSDTKAQTKVKGWMFDFELDAPRELLEIGLLAGWGRHNAEGFGCGEVGSAGVDRPSRFAKPGRPGDAGEPRG